MKWPKLLKVYLPNIILIAAALIFSRWLMWHTFDCKDGFIKIAPKAWSDFSAHIPLIRSFSWGHNWPPEYPLFPGEPIRYHFGFYLLVGWLEKIGLPLGWALNLPSALGFAAMLVTIYFLGILLFKRRLPALLAVIFLLFNGSLSFLEFFKQHPLSWQTPQVILKNNTFPSFGPYDGKIVSAFWNLNIFTNQRHLGLAYFSLLLVIYLLLKRPAPTQKFNWRSIVLIILALGLLPMLHKGVLIMTAVILAGFFIFFPKMRWTLLVIGLGSSLLVFPQFIGKFEANTNLVSLRPGYLITPPLTLISFLHYWLLNLGVSAMLIPLGFFLTGKTAKRLFLSVLPIFIVANLFQFTPEIAANHKFFNFFIIIGNLFSGWAIYRIWQLKNWGKLLALPLIFLMTFSGIIDFFPIKNDRLGGLADAPLDPDVAWIASHTPPDAVFLNSSYIFHPASLAGRKIMMGWPYFAWSAGYNTDRRGKLMQQMLAPSSLTQLCQQLKDNHISYISIEKPEANQDFKINHFFFRKNFALIYQNQSSNIEIFSVLPTCKAYE